MVLWTAVEAARNAAAELGSDGGLRGAYRCLMQLLDDYRRAVRRDGVAAGGRLFEDAPPATGDARVDAAMAGLAEHLARRDGWMPPLWAFEEARQARPWWFVSDVRSWHAAALVESPLAFRKRGVFLTATALERV
ncbi:MAG TPA: hypothetical protein VNV66_08020 [Pilimelia sp.]|nr:hypothetical protein [Pilimelia sp.]